MKTYLFILILAALSMLFAACAQKSQENCKDIFERYYEKNVEVFMTTLTNQNSNISQEEARRAADYLLHGLYEKDSSYVKMSGKDQDKFIAANFPVLMENYKIEREKQLKTFEDYFDKNIESFTKVMQANNKDIPQKKARDLGTYLLRGLFNINPEFVTMNGEDQDRFISENMPGLIKSYQEKK